MRVLLLLCRDEEVEMITEIYHPRRYRRGITDAIAFAGQAVRPRVGLALLPLLLVVAGCGAATEGTPSGAVETPAPTQAAPATATAPPETASIPTTPMPAAPVTKQTYDHAADYSWLAGQLKQEGSCWVVTYISPLVDIQPDQYNNRLALLPGSGWDQAKV